MILFKISNKMICILDNPKCGSSTLRKWYETLYMNKNIKIIYESKSAYFNNLGYRDSNYMHCNLQGAINLCITKRIKPKYVDFICVIRHPIERYKSAYLYHNNFHNQELFDNNSTCKEMDFNKYVYNEGHYHNFYPDKFRTFGNFKVNVVKLENLKNDFERLFKNLNISINCDVLNEKLNKSNKELNIKLSNEIIDYITEKFKIDYIDGNYSNDEYMDKS